MPSGSSGMSPAVASKTASRIASCACGIRQTVQLPARIEGNKRNHVCSYKNNRSNQFVESGRVQANLSARATTSTAVTADGVKPGTGSGDVKAILFDMDGVLCESEELSRSVGAKVLKELYGLDVTNEEFVPFVGTGEANFLGGVARKYGAPFDAAAAKKRFFELYLQETAKPGCSIGFPGAKEVVQACREAGLKTAVASSADRVKVDANLKAAGLDAATAFDAIVSADNFERLKPAPDVFLAAAKELGVAPQNCVVIEDAPAGVQAAKAAGMRCVGVTTSITQALMETHGPDAVRSSISAISLEDLVGLQWSERQRSGQSASTSTPVQSQSQSQQEPWLEAEVQLPGGFKTRRRELLKLLPLLGAAGAGYSLFQQAQSIPKMGAASEQEERVAAFKRYIASKEARLDLEAVPEFPPGLTWFNSPPLKLSRELRGKVVIYDFWTFCCINCMHILPSLARLEAKYADSPFAVVGVHSAKFDNEKDDSSIRSAILRYEIQHPCVNDGSMSLWRQLGISSWPTLAVLSPRGDLIATLPGNSFQPFSLLNARLLPSVLRSRGDLTSPSAGEGQEANADAFIQAALEFYGEKGQLDATPIPSALERDRDPRLATSPLRFPGKLAFDAASDRIFVSDSNNNRLVVVDARGKYVDQVGGNGSGLRDGSFEEAAFCRPQGLAFCSKTGILYVADTENHALRQVDFSSRKVTTLAGNGAKGSDYVGGGSGRSQQLNSPWDVALDAEAKVVYIAMAGQHQVWRHELASGKSYCFSGDGYERNANGAAGSTSWAQPSGLSLSPDGRTLWVADSESSSIRTLSLADASSKGHVGGDPLFSDNLFRFGDRDGVGTDARLQHPLAVCALPDGRVLVADSYNHKLKVLEPASDRISTLAGTGKPGFEDGRGSSCQLSEPGGLALGPSGSVLVADTNNSLIRVLDPKTGSLRTLELQGIPPPQVSPGTRLDADQFNEPLPSGAALVTMDPVKASKGELRLRLELPEGYHLTKGATSSFEVSVSDAKALAVEPAVGTLTGDDQPGAVLKFRKSAAAKARVQARIYFCKEEDVCLFHEVVFDVPFAEGDGPAGVLLSHNVPANAPVTSF